MTETPRSAGVVIVRQEAGAWRVLMLRAYRNWDFPKGQIEPGEDRFAAALREVHEETGIEADELTFEWGDAHYETPPYNKGKTATYFLARTPRQDITLPVNRELGKPEHDEWRWLTFEAAQQLAVPRVQAALAWAQQLLACPGNV